MYIFFSFISFQLVLYYLPAVYHQASASTLLTSGSSCSTVLTIGWLRTWCPGSTPSPCGPRFPRRSPCLHLRCIKKPLKTSCKENGKKARSYFDTGCNAPILKRSRVWLRTKRKALRATCILKRRQAIKIISIQALSLGKHIFGHSLSSIYNIGL